MCCVVGQVVIMADHTELVAEIALVEKMATQDRLKHAKKRRNQQLKKYAQYEKQLDKESKKKNKDKNHLKHKRNNNQKRTIKVHFVSNVMLLEAAARNDINEGKTSSVHYIVLIMYYVCNMMVLKY